MFDNLRDRLGSFRDEASEAAEPVEPDEEPVEDDTDETAPASDVDSEAAKPVEPDEEPPADETEETAPAPDTDSEPAESVEAEPDTGLGRKARSFAKGEFVIDEDALEGPLEDLELALITSDVAVDVAGEIVDTIREELVGETRTVGSSTAAVVEAAVLDAIVEVIGVGQFDFEDHIAAADKPVVIVFTGVNGVGKTTTIAKLSRYLEERGYSSVLANGDTYRAGAAEQIAEHADALDRKLIAHEQGGDPAAVLYDAVEYAEANDVDVVLGDTAGRLHTDSDLMAQLEKIDRVVDPDMTLFVDESVAGQDAVKRAAEFHDAAPYDGIILTKADADSNGGAALSVAYVTGKPILFLGTGQEYDDLARFDPDAIADFIVGS